MMKINAFNEHFELLFLFYAAYTLKNPSHFVCFWEISPVVHLLLKAVPPQQEFTKKGQS